MGRTFEDVAREVQSRGPLNRVKCILMVHADSGAGWYGIGGLHYVFDNAPPPIRGRVEHLKTFQPAMSVVTSSTYSLVPSLAGSDNGTLEPNYQRFMVAGSDERWDVDISQSVSAGRPSRLPRFPFHLSIASMSYNNRSWGLGLTQGDGFLKGFGPGPGGMGLAHYSVTLHEVEVIPQ